MVLAAPLPVIFNVPLLARSGNALVSVIVPLALVAKVIVSALPAALAAVIASRSEQSATSQLPSLVSAVLVTTNACGTGVLVGDGVGVDDGVGDSDGGGVSVGDGDGVSDGIGVVDGVGVSGPLNADSYAPMSTVPNWM